jgi:uncharacterized integral membrane protein (TIGR00697 family)
MPFILGTHLSVAVFFFPFVYIITDIVGHLYGKELAKQFVYAGFLSIVIFLLYSIISVSMPWSPKGEWVHQSYNTIFGISFRMSLASVLAYIIAEYQDVISFFFFEKVFRGRGFWLKSNLSNLWSQLLDTFIFMFVAFLGVYSVPTIIMMGLPWYIYKVLMGIIYTPLSYFVIGLLSRDESDTIKREITT